MMVKRPKILDIFSLFLLVVAVSFPVQIMLIYGHSPTEIMAILTKVTSLNWLVMLALTVNAYLVFKASPAVKWTLPLAALLVGFNNWVVGKWGQDFSSLQTWLASGGFVCCHAVLCRKSIIELLNHPDRRWWLTPERRKVEVLAYVSPYNGAAFKAKTFDISEGGAFIPLTAEELDSKGSRGSRKKPLGIDDRVSLCLTLGLAQIRCDARVVRNTDGKGMYPAGIGISFVGMQRQQKKELRRFIKHVGSGLRELPT